MRTSALAALVLLAFTAPVFADEPLGYGLRPNQARKIAIVVDSSSSNTGSDPDDLRVNAAKALNDALYSKAESPEKPDQVAVIDFDDTASVNYPLGDPAGAVNAFDSIDSSGGTNIEAGLQKALIELNKGGDTARRSGIVVLTDGENNGGESPVIAQLVVAKDDGVRVSVGFLGTASTPPNPTSELISAIRATGGIHFVINGPESQTAFINAVITNGPTEIDDPNPGSDAFLLFPGLTTTSPFGTGEAHFKYDALPNENLNLSISTTPYDTSLQGTLKVANGGADLVTANADSNGLLSIQYTSTERQALDLTVKGKGAPGKLAQVESNSNIRRDQIFKEPPPDKSIATGGMKTPGEGMMMGLAVGVGYVVFLMF